MIQKMVFTCLMLASSVAALPGGALGTKKSDGDADHRTFRSISPHAKNKPASAKTVARAKVQPTEEVNLIQQLTKAMDTKDWKNSDHLVNKINRINQERELERDLENYRTKGNFMAIGETIKKLADLQKKTDSLDPSPAPERQASATSSDSRADGKFKSLMNLIGLAEDGSKARAGDILRRIANVLDKEDSKTQ